jgi:hypothetical protein
VKNAKQTSFPNGSVSSRSGKRPYAAVLVGYCANHLPGDKCVGTETRLNGQQVRFRPEGSSCLLLAGERCPWPANAAIKLFNTRTGRDTKAYSGSIGQLHSYLARLSAKKHPTNKRRRKLFTSSEERRKYRREHPEELQS